MHPDLVELLALLQSHGVEFLVVGSTALAVHAQPRYTEDIDLWVRRSEANTQRLADALREFGLNLTAPQLAEFWKADRQMITLGAKPQAVDLLNFLGDDRFEDAWDRRVVVEFGGVQVAVIGLNDFVRAKRVAGRPKDLADLAILEEIHGPQP